MSRFVWCLCAILVGSLLANAAMAQLAPPPQKSPRTPVSSHPLVNAKDSPALPASRILEGQASILDAQTLRLNGFTFRLMGVVPPQMGASYGPQARAALDSLAQGTVTCKMMDRQKDGNLLGSCHNAQGQDFGLELLKRGLAATARGSLAGSPLASSYILAEQAAQTQRLGLWTSGVPTPVSTKDMREEAAKNAQKKQQEEAQAKAAAEAAKAAQAAEAKTEPSEDTATSGVTVPAPTTTVSLSTATNLDQSFSSLPTVTPLPDELEDPTAQEEVATTATSSSFLGFLERFQTILAALLALGAAALYGLSRVYAHRKDKHDERSAIAAALRGELLAARSVCKARLAKITQEGEEAAGGWPRIRTLVFQAYVGRLGLLGAELSRQIASIYGQTSDYASYYKTHEGKSDTTSKTHALETLIKHIDEVNPRLAYVETKGHVPTTPSRASSPKSLSYVGKATPSLPRPTPAAPMHDGEATPEPKPTEPPKEPVAEKPITPEEKKPIPPEIAINLSDAKTEIAGSALEEKAPPQEDEQATGQAQTDTSANKPQKKVQQGHPTSQKAGATRKPTENDASAAMMAHTNNAPKGDGLTAAVAAFLATLPFTPTLMEKLAKLKELANDRLHQSQAAPQMQDYTIPDYANLTDAELEILLAAEEEYYATLTPEKVG